MSDPYANVIVDKERKSKMTNYQKALKEAQRLAKAGIKLTEAEKNLLRYLAQKG